MPSSRLWLIALGLILLCAVVVYKFVRPKTFPVPTLEVSQLLQEYGAGKSTLSDPINHEQVAQELDKAVHMANAANAKYRNKRVEVSGIVFETGMTSEKNIFVSLRDQNEPNPSFVVMCCFPSGSRSVEHKAGELLRIRGTCMGRVGNVILQDCVVVNNAP